MPTITVALVERVLITLPQAQRISASTYLGWMSVFIKWTHIIAWFELMTSSFFKKAEKLLNESLTVPEISGLITNPLRENLCTPF
jgi:hypothetical protein